MTFISIGLLKTVFTMVVLLISSAFPSTFAFVSHQGVISRLSRPSIVYQRTLPVSVKTSTLLLAGSNSASDTERLAFIIVDHGSRKAEANDMLLDIVRKYKDLYGVEVAEAAHMELAEPSISTAFRKCVEQGATRIVCHPFFLSRGRHVQEDIPSLLRAAAEEHPQLQIDYSITQPLGAYDKILDLMHHAMTQAETK